jgi:hypothetical protein
MEKPIFAPFVYIDSSSIDKISTCGSTWVGLAFGVNVDANGNVIWDSGKADPQTIVQQVDALHAKRGGAFISWGGASAGDKKSKFFGELARRYESDPQGLCDMYIKTADLLHIKWIDFDIEADAPSDSKHNDVRNQALILLKQKRPDIRLTFTVPVNYDGFDGSVEKTLRDAHDAGVKLHTVNIMVMYVLQKSQKGVTMSDAAIHCVDKVKSLVVDTMGCKLGVVVLPGQNEDPNYRAENFTLDDATALVKYAAPLPWLRFLGFWTTKNDGSYIDSDGQFAKRFSAF